MKNTVDSWQWQNCQESTEQNKQTKTHCTKFSKYHFYLAENCHGTAASDGVWGSARVWMGVFLFPVNWSTPLLLQTQLCGSVWLHMFVWLITLLSDQGLRNFRWPCGRGSEMSSFPVLHMNNSMELPALLKRQMLSWTSCCINCTHFCHSYPQTWEALPCGHSGLYFNRNQRSGLLILGGITSHK